MVKYHYFKYCKALTSVSFKTSLEIVTHCSVLLNKSLTVGKNNFKMQNLGFFHYCEKKVKSLGVLGWGGGGVVGFFFPQNKQSIVMFSF